MPNAVEQTAVDMANARKATTFDPSRIYMTLNEARRRLGVLLTPAGHA